MAISFVFIDSFSKTVFEQKKIMLKINSAASNRSQGKLTYLMYFPWPPLETGLSISTILCYLRLLQSLFFLTHKLLQFR
jgi:hypothetical protein